MQKGLDMSAAGYPSRHLGVRSRPGCGVPPGLISSISRFPDEGLIKNRRRGRR